MGRVPILQLVVSVVAILLMALLGRLADQLTRPGRGFSEAGASEPARRATGPPGRPAPESARYAAGR